MVEEIVIQAQAEIYANFIFRFAKVVKLTKVRLPQRSVHPQRAGKDGVLLDIKTKTWSYDEIIENFEKVVKIGCY